MLKQAGISSNSSTQNNNSSKNKRINSTKTRNNYKITSQSTQIHKLSQESNQELEMMSKIRNTIHHISQTNDDKIIITRYLRTMLFDDHTDSKIKQFEILNKSIQTGILGDHLKEIIVKLSNLDENRNVNKPIFAAWENSIFFQVKGRITSHIIEANI